MRDRDFIERLIDRAKAADCSTLVLTLDLQIIGQRHKDLKNGMIGAAQANAREHLNLMTKPRWCLGMAGTPRHRFGNLIGHVKGVSDMALAVSAVDARAVRPAARSGTTWPGSGSAGAAS